MKKSMHMGTFAAAGNDVESGVAKRPERSSLKRIGLAGCVALSVPALLYSAMALAAFGNAYLTFDGYYVSGYAETLLYGDQSHTDPESCEWLYDNFFECDVWFYGGMSVEFTLRDPSGGVQASESGWGLWHADASLPLTEPSISGWWTGVSQHYVDWEIWRVFCYTWYPEIWPEGAQCELYYWKDYQTTLEDTVYAYVYVPPP